MTLDFLPETLLPWFAEHRRDLPWRRDREPYHVWLSEIMLQQTRVEAVRGYYERFLAALPTVQALADAPEDRLLKLWEGLGYYSRARNLQKAAQVIVTQHGGVFPREYDDVRALPGIGPYTAGAICSICFELPTPAVDGNVLRVAARLLRLDAPVTEERIKRGIGEMLEKIYPAGRCGDFTQALMELGATVCLPNGEPKCALCPVAAFCAARAAGEQMRYPVKAEKKPRRREDRTVFLLRCEGAIAVCRRPEKGLLAGLWQLPDVPSELTAQEALAQAAQWGTRPTGIEKKVHRTHIFTHVQWELTGFYLDCAVQAPQFFWAGARELEENLGLPTAYRQFLEEPLASRRKNGYTEATKE